jgi:hypothetical protein
LSSQNNLSLAEALASMMQELELEVLETCYSKVIKTSKEIAEFIDDDYDMFFHDMHSLLGTDDVPDMIKRFVSRGEWIDISERWNKVKVKHGVITPEQNRYYLGITGSRTLSLNRLGRKKSGRAGAEREVYATKKKPGKAKVPAFGSYLKTLQAPGTVQKFFGPVTLNYGFESPTGYTSIGAKMGPNAKHPNVLPNQIRHIWTRNRVKNTISSSIPSELRITANIEAFGRLKEVKKFEWFMVDFILKRIDPSHEKQWVKINGQRGGKGKGRRPIRAIVLPLVQYYMNKKLPDSIRRTLGTI